MRVRIILAIIATGFRSLRRDRVAFILSFVLPIAFFTIFGFVFGGMKTSSTTAKVPVILVDQDKSDSSQRLIKALGREPSLECITRPKATKENPNPGDYSQGEAEAEIHSGHAPAALVIPKGFSDSLFRFTGSDARPTFLILNDSSDPIAAEVISGMLQKTIMFAMPAKMAVSGTNFFEQQMGGFTPEQHKKLDTLLAQAQKAEDQQASDNNSNSGTQGGMVAIEKRDIVGEHKKSPLISYYAAAVGVMFLLFTASGSAGSLLDEVDNGTLDRVLSTRVSMTELLLGKMLYTLTLATCQLCLMFLWAALIFKLDLFTHIPGFLVMTVSTAFAVACFGMFLASLAKTRAQLSAISTLLILTMSALGGSMIPKIFMPEMLITIGRFTFNSWAIDGYTKVFWRDQPVSSLGTEVGVLVLSGIILFALARIFARRWEAN